MANHSMPLYSAFCNDPEKYQMNIRTGLSPEEIRERDRKFLKIWKRKSKNMIGTNLFFPVKL